MALSAASMKNRLNLPSVIHRLRRAVNAEQEGQPKPDPNPT
jgi:hypothetical protein